MLVAVWILHRFNARQREKIEKIRKWRKKSDKSSSISNVLLNVCAREQNFCIICHCTFLVFSSYLFFALVAFLEATRTLVHCTISIYVCLNVCIPAENNWHLEQHASVTSCRPSQWKKSTQWEWWTWEKLGKNPHWNRIDAYKNKNSARWVDIERRIGKNAPCRVFACVLAFIGIFFCLAAVSLSHRRFCASYDITHCIRINFGDCYQSTIFTWPSRI